MQQLVSGLGKLVFLVLLIGAAVYLYFAYGQNRPDPARLAALAKTAVNPAAAPVPANVPPPRPKRSAVKLPESLQVYVNRVAEAFVRDHYNRLAHVKFLPKGYRVLGNRDYRFFTVVSAASGRNDQGQFVTLPWKARIFWRDSFWYLIRLEVGGKTEDTAQVKEKRGTDPARYENEPVETSVEAVAETEIARPAAPPEEAVPPSEPTAAAMAAAPPSAEVPTERTWMDITGKHSLVAVLLAVVDGKAKFRKSDGTELEVPLKKLSEADQAWIAAHPP